MCLFLVVVSIIFFIILFVIATVLRNIRRREKKHAKFKPATVIITQTPGNQSPRALAHATALLSISPEQTILFLSESPAPPILHSNNIHFIPITQPPKYTKTTGWTTFKKLCHFTKSLCTALNIASQLDYKVTNIIVNIPPTLPTLPIVSLLYRFLFPHTSYLTIDVHNLGFTLMKLSSNKSKFVLWIVKNIELICLKMCARDNCWTVSNAMTRYLTDTLGLKMVHTLHDQPRIIKSSCDENQLSITEVLKQSNSTIYPHKPNPLISYDKMEMIISASSWTPDEDFTMMLEALPMLDKSLEYKHSPILLLLTGKGPLRSKFECQVSQLHLRNITVAFAWLPISQYTRMLSHATVGICLHTSSSGLDLPMKAVDLIGARTPVIAFKYDCIFELIKTYRNGLVFENSFQLYKCMYDVILNNNRVADGLREYIGIFRLEDVKDWDSCWKRIAFYTLKW